MTAPRATARAEGAMVSRAIVLGGGDNAALGPLTGCLPKPLLPILNRPLIDWQIAALCRAGIEEVGVALSPDNADLVSRHLEAREASPPRLHIAVDEVPRGPAGAIKLFESLLQGEPFLVVDGGTFLGDVRIDALVRAHRARGAAVTMGVLPPVDAASSARAVVSEDGRVEGVFELHGSRDRRRSRSLVGLNVFDPEVLDVIPDAGHSDVKERLLGELQERGALVAAETAEGFCTPIDSVQRYFELQVGLLQGDFVAGNGYRQVADGVWIGEGSEVSPSAYVLGPVLVGDDCRIGDGAQLVGPVVIGDGCQVGEGCVVRGSFLWESNQLAPGCKVENSVVVSGASLSEGTWVRGSITGPATVGGGEPGGFAPAQSSPLSAPSEKRLPWTTAAFKALMDSVGAGLLLLLVSPVLLVCAAVIRLDSKGPVLFRQRRCGKGGRQFWMYKFRTMVEDAEARQAELKAHSDADGPVFKMFADPRITGPGRVLRRTSLDELPQLLNVLRGEMSLVGPRPLAADEMRYCPAWRDRRLSVKPGVTGLWQVSGRSRTKFHDWIQYDIEYVKHQSIGLDLQILFKTVAAVIRRSGAV